MKELQLRNEMREEMAKKDQQLAQLQAREKELQEALNRVQETETNTKHDLAFLSKEKVAYVPYLPFYSVTRYSNVGESDYCRPVFWIKLFDGRRESLSSTSTRLLFVCLVSESFGNSTGDSNEKR